MMTKFSLALVTGASSGIGEELCRLLADQGIDLIISGRNSEKLQQLSEELQKKIKVITIEADLSTADGRQKLVDQIHLHTPDLIINNAGFGLYGHALTMHTKQLTDMVKVDVIAPQELTLEGARALIAARKRGVILNVSSAAAFFVYPSFAVYAASKAYLNSFSEALYEELRKYNIQILTSCPGMVETNFRNRAGGSKLSNEERWNVMTVRYAAQEIWWQIQKRKPIHIFDWKYRFYVFLSRLLPNKLIRYILNSSIKNRLPS